MAHAIEVNPQNSFTFFPIAPHVAGSGDVMVVGTARRFEEVARYSFVILAYRFDRATVRKRDIAPFLEFFDLERIERAGLLHGLYNRVMVDFTGYEGDKRWLYDRNETRDFIRKLLARWPYFGYAAFLPMPNRYLQQMAFCVAKPRGGKPDPARPDQLHAGLSDHEVRLYVDTFVRPYASLCDRDPLMTPTLRAQREEALLTALTSPGSDPLPDGLLDTTRASIVRLDPAANAMAACLESIFRDVGIPFTQRQWCERVGGSEGANDAATASANLGEALHEHGFVGKVIDTTRTRPEDRLANFRDTVARYRGIYAMLITRHWQPGDGRSHCVRLLGTTPLLRVMNPDGGTIETWSDREVLAREVQLYLIQPWEYAVAYPNGGPAPKGSSRAPVVTELPPPAPDLPDEIKPEVARRLQADLALQPAGQPRVNPVTGLAIPPFADVAEQIVLEDLFQKVDRQLRDPQTPAIRTAYDRMVVAGCHPEEARELIACIFAACLRHARAKGQPIDLDHYTRELMTATGGDWPV